MRAMEWRPYREGAVVSADPDTGSLVDVGLYETVGMLLMRGELKIKLLLGARSAIQSELWCCFCWMGSSMCPLFGAWGRFAACCHSQQSCTVALCRQHSIQVESLLPHSRSALGPDPDCCALSPSEMQSGVDT